MKLTNKTQSGSNSANDGKVVNILAYLTDQPSEKQNGDCDLLYIIEHQDLEERHFFCPMCKKRFYDTYPVSYPTHLVGCDGCGNKGNLIPQLRRKGK